ncbi:NAD-dependent protein deacetylase Sirt6 [Cydia pomonella]|uniref:NAD-dependent protein deacetylase Sirt6 n=1 Tax=Cydia pomonella TaxID=82600 RepID=UPI002ADD7660|nr:NAD-dependent protein deacetylase Sirt6 [Cydia pomonella]
MSCNYAEGLSPYEHKGVLGIPEKFDSVATFNKKCDLLAQLINQSKHVVVHTGAGISTSAGIPDFRGPNGVWTLEKKGKKPSINVSFADAKPTKTHLILKKLVECDKVHYIVSQNIDGLHLKSGLSRDYLSELHGNMFVDECNLCKRQFVRSAPVETVGKKCSGVPCAAAHVYGRPCRGRLYDGVLDWEHSLPENDLLMAEWHSSIADLSICLGTTLQIIPSGNLPLETVKYGGKLVICNLQPTKHDNKADLVINYYVDDVLEKVMNILRIDIPTYSEDENPMKKAESTVVEWTIDRYSVLTLEKMFKAKCKGVKKKRVLIKKRNSDMGISGTNCDDKAKIIKLEVKEEIDDNKTENGHLNIVNENGQQVIVKNEQNDVDIVGNGQKSTFENEQNDVDIVIENGQQIKIEKEQNDVNMENKIGQNHTVENKQNDVNENGQNIVIENEHNDVDVANENGQQITVENENG